MFFSTIKHLKQVLFCFKKKLEQMFWWIIFNSQKKQNTNTRISGLKTKPAKYLLSFSFLVLLWLTSQSKATADALSHNEKTTTPTANLAYKTAESMNYAFLIKSTQWEIDTSYVKRMFTETWFLKTKKEIAEFNELWNKAQENEYRDIFEKIIVELYELTPENIKENNTITLILLQYAAEGEIKEIDNNEVEIVVWDQTNYSIVENAIKTVKEDIVLGLLLDTTKGRLQTEIERKRENERWKRLDEKIKQLKKK